MKVRKMMKRMTVLGLALLMTVISIPQECMAESLPYTTYNYDYWEDIVYTPAAYVPSSSVAGTALEYQGENIGAFSNPQDLCKTPDGDIVIADTGNNRIVILNQNMTQVKEIISGFDNEGTADSFNAPYGVAVSEKNQLYIADSQNRRVVVLNQDRTLAKIVQNPQSEVLADDFVFTPLKVSVDYADRIYCIAQKMFEGIMVFENTGEFTGFIGTINVEITLWEKFWKKIATKEERSKQQLYIPTEFTGIDIDPDGFVYASNIDATGIQGVRRLNPKGQDVIKKGTKQNVGGDLQIEGSTEYSGPSQFTDVVYRQNGIYSCLDRKRGRIFTYDHEGNLLYIFGGLGTQRGTFTMPVAIEDINGSLVVLDASRGELSMFEVTEYGRLINEAVSLRYDGDEAQAVALWERVLELDENNELANTGIGKAYLTAGDYVQAMKYLELGMSRDYYSVAYKRYRNNILTENAEVVLTGMMVIIIGGVVINKVRKKKQNNKNHNNKKGGSLNA